MTLPSLGVRSLEMNTPIMWSRCKANSLALEFCLNSHSTESEWYYFEREVSYIQLVEKNFKAQWIHSTLLKSDQWLRESHHVEHGVRGAINFRQVPGTNIYALGQPTTEAINEVVRRIRREHPSSQKVVWITLREEPIVYINGAPYCLRREGFSLRNMKGGVFVELPLSFS